LELVGDAALEEVLDAVELPEAAVVEAGLEVVAATAPLVDAGVAAVDPPIGAVDWPSI